jgi:hypothetical protein
LRAITSQRNYGSATILGSTTAVLLWALAAAVGGVVLSGPRPKPGGCCPAAAAAPLKGQDPLPGV